MTSWTSASLNGEDRAGVQRLLPAEDVLELRQKGNDPVLDLGAVVTERHRSDGFLMRPAEKEGDGGFASSMVRSSSLRSSSVNETGT